VTGCRRQKRRADGESKDARGRSKKTNYRRRTSSQTAAACRPSSSQSNRLLRPARGTATVPLARKPIVSGDQNFEPNAVAPDGFPPDGFRPDGFAPLINDLQLIGLEGQYASRDAIDLSAFGSSYDSYRSESVHSALSGKSLKRHASVLGILSPPDHDSEAHYDQNSAKRRAGPSRQRSQGPSASFELEGQSTVLSPQSNPSEQYRRQIIKTEPIEFTDDDSVSRLSSIGLPSTFPEGIIKGSPAARLSGISPAPMTQALDLVSFAQINGLNSDLSGDMQVQMEDDNLLLSLDIPTNSAFGRPPLPKAYRITDPDGPAHFELFETFSDTEEYDGCTDADALARAARRKADRARRLRIQNVKYRPQIDDDKWKVACVRCRFQKLRCRQDATDSDGYCVPCKSFSRSSKKTIHRTPCYREKLSDVVLYRKGGLNLTKRWSGTEMKNVTERGGPDTVHHIEFTLGIFGEPIRIDVVPFVPIEGDETVRYWTVKEGGLEVRKFKHLEAFCLADIHQTAEYFETYVQSNAIEAFMSLRGPMVSDGSGSQALPDIMERTYIYALAHYWNLPNTVKTSSTSQAIMNREKKLLGSLFVLWFATRHTTGSAHICGKDTLGMAPETQDPTYPLLGKVSLPRMILAQFDSLVYTKILTIHGRTVLRELEWLILQNNQEHWFTIYSCLFILLREATWLSQDRYRHGRAVHGNAVSKCPTTRRRISCSSLKMRYSIPEFVEELQEGCNRLLMYWHYYNCRPLHDPRTEVNPERIIMTPDQYDLIEDTKADPHIREQLDYWRRYKEENGVLDTPTTSDANTDGMYTGPQSKMDWDNSFYWISQLYEPDWQAHPTYRR
jgi:hypothetical protein